MARFSISVMYHALLMHYATVFSAKLMLWRCYKTVIFIICTWLKRIEGTIAQMNANNILHNHVRCLPKAYEIQQRNLSSIQYGMFILCFVRPFSILFEYVNYFTFQLHY